VRGFLESCTSDGAGRVVLQDGVGAVHVQCDLSVSRKNSRMQLVVRTWFALGASESLAGLDTT
jgi:hypothetical protein